MNNLSKVDETINAKELTETEEKFVQQVIGSTIINGCNFKIYGTIGNPLFIAKDIAEVLGHSHVPTMMQSIDSDEKLVCTILTSGQRRDVNCLTEYGLYELLMQSRKPIAKEFKKGVKKVLHELRTKGEVRVNYNIPQTYSEALLLAANQAKQIEEQQKLIEVQTPKVEFFDAVADSKTAIQMNDVAKTLAIKGFGRNNLFEFLRSKNILMRNNQPYQKYVDLGYFRVIEQRYQKDNEECINFKTLVYQKGVDFIRKTILSNVSSIGKNNKELNS